MRARAKADMRSLRTCLEAYAVDNGMYPIDYDEEFPNPVRRGVLRRLRTGRLNLAYALSKQGRRWEAIQAVLPSLVETPGLPSWRNLLSILVG